MSLSQKPRYSGPGQDAINKWTLRPKAVNETGARRHGHSHKWPGAVIGFFLNCLPAFVGAAAAVLIFG